MKLDTHLDLYKADDASYQLISHSNTIVARKGLAARVTIRAEPVAIADGISTLEQMGNKYRSD